LKEKAKKKETAQSVTPDPEPPYKKLETNMRFVRREDTRDQESLGLMDFDHMIEIVSIYRRNSNI